MISKLKRLLVTSSILPEERVFLALCLTFVLTFVLLVILFLLWVTSGWVLIVLIPAFILGYIFLSWALEEEV